MKGIGVLVAIGALAVSSCAAQDVDHRAAAPPARATFDASPRHELVEAPRAPEATPAAPALAKESAPLAAPADGAPSDETARAFFGIPADPWPPSLVQNTHYVVSNEDRPQSFRDAVSGRGGVYVGVGAEQSFLFGGWSRADRLFLVDFDDWVVHINVVHGIVFQHAKTPDDVLALWGEDHVADVEAWIDQDARDAPTALRRKRVYEHGRAQVEFRLRWLRTHLGGLGVPFFGNDQGELDRLATLFRDKRVRCVRGDLTADGTLKAFGDLATRSGWVVRVLYLSNAETYFSHDTGSFKANLASLPIDDRSVVLHTMPLGAVGYTYYWGDTSSYRAWVEQEPTFFEVVRAAQLPKHGTVESGAWRIPPPRP